MRYLFVDELYYYVLVLNSRLYVIRLVILDIFQEQSRKDFARNAMNRTPMKMLRDSTVLRSTGTEGFILLVRLLQLLLVGT